ncbi:hypothetical protein LX36DRAFT_660606 [Colletotrichum falcatum]|nr:hypothetical protein LX36DRAFT_660606 [Colletotrichum falcatum]
MACTTNALRYPSSFLLALIDIASLSAFSLKLGERKPPPPPVALGHQRPKLRHPPVWSSWLVVLVEFRGNERG